jgi:hypothetical protein
MIPRAHMARVHQMATSSLRLCRSESGEERPTSVLPVINDQQTRSNISLTNLAIHLCVDKAFL